MRAFGIYGTCLLFVFSAKGLKAQQNFINVPSGDVTDKKRVFFQQQINIDRNIQANSTLDYGLGKGYEIGLNLLGCTSALQHARLVVNDTGSGNAYSPLVLVNGLKAQKLGHHFTVVGGVQLGANYSRSHHSEGVGLFYGNVVVSELGKREGKVVGGVYYDTQRYGGERRRMGSWMGIEVTTSKRTHLVMESIVGTASMAYTSIAFVYYPRSYLPITAGVQIPNARQNPYSVVFELTFIPKKSLH